MEKRRRGRPPKPKLKLTQEHINDALECIERGLQGGDIGAALAVIDRVAPKPRPVNEIDLARLKMDKEKHRFELAKLEAETIAIIDEKTDFSKLSKITLQAIAAAMKKHGL